MHDEKNVNSIADPAHSVKICSTREDFLIPSACLNSTISGLMTRTVERKDLIGEYDFVLIGRNGFWSNHHGSKP